MWRVAQNVLTGIVVVLTFGAIGFVLRGALPTSGASGARPDPPVAAIAPDPEPFSAASIQSRAVPRGNSLIAVSKSRRAISVYSRPESRRRWKLRARVLDRQRLPLRFMVVDKRKGWVRIQLPGRPNGSLAWVRRRDVRIAHTPFKLIIERKKHRLLLLRRGRIAKRFRIAVGAAATPTTRGRFYVTDLIRSKDPFYGPYALGLSAHSKVLTSYAGGNGQLGIHGTNDPSSIGNDVSHGCIRVHNGVIKRLARIVPVGTPVVIR